MSVDPYADLASDSVFSAALPYATGTLTVAGVGTYTLITMANASVALQVAAIAATLFGGYGFLMTIVQGVYSRNSTEFKANIHKALSIAAGAAITEIITAVAHAVLTNLINDTFDRRRR